MSDEVARHIAEVRLLRRRVAELEEALRAGQKLRVTWWAEQHPAGEISTEGDVVKVSTLKL